MPSGTRPATLLDPGGPIRACEGLRCRRHRRLADPDPSVTTRIPCTRPPTGLLGDGREDLNEVGGGGSGASVLAPPCLDEAQQLARVVLRQREPVAPEDMFADLLRLGQGWG